MSSNLLIVESPSKAKTLKKYLGKDFEILASFGHVRDLVPKQGAVDPDNKFAMDYQLIERNAKHVDEIIKAAAGADQIYLATDPDREGEAIAWHISEILATKPKLKAKPIRRVAFYEITESAVKNAIANPRDISMPLVNAQQARRALDYLVGFNLSPLLWRKVRPGLSAGRVQSPALRLITERELEIQGFKAQEYWTIHLDSHKGADAFSARLFQYRGEKLKQFDIANEAREREIVSDFMSGGEISGKIVTVERKRKLRYAAPPFTTSTLQQEAVRKLGMTTDRAMRIAQQLYEGIDIGGATVGLITYMRTDSLSLANEAVQEIRDYVGKSFDREYLPQKPVVYKSKIKNAQEAHEAIRPTSILRAPESLSKFLNPDQFRLYEIIWKRTLASQMSPAQFDTVSLDIAVAHPDSLFRATGQTLVFPGFIAVYREGVDDEEESAEGKLPQLEPGESVPVDKLFGEQHFTQPPPRYSEASLVKTLEEFGIGRPSTYASIISTLLDREYVTLDKKRFIPTDVGYVVNRFLTEHFASYLNYDFTANLEDQLDSVSAGSRDWIPLLEDFWGGFSALIEEKKNISRKDVTQEILDEACPKCGKPLCTRLGRRGRFIGCSAFPECDYTRNMGDEEDSSGNEPQILGLDEASGLPVLLLKGPYGHYLQIGETGEGKKPKRVSWPKEIPVASASMDIAGQLLSLPREVGLHPDTGKKIVANIGRFGPYVNHDGAFKSIPKNESVFTIDLERAVALLAEAKVDRNLLRELGVHPDGKPVGVYSGRYGPYVKHGRDNAKIPSGMDADTVTLEAALEALSLKAEKPAKGRKTPAKKPEAKKPAAKKAAAKPRAAAKKTASEPAAGKKVAG
ncbi:MAG: type I DNA topoisomerase [Burkholderiales bacterium]|nr:type I DNA topoisomerase [Burkholderiales bacterium]